MRRLFSRILLLFGLPLLVVAVGSIDPPSPRRAGAEPQGGAPPKRLQDAIGHFEEQRYRRALDALEALRADDPDLRPREVTFYRAASALRLAQMSGDDETQRRERLALQAMAEENVDLWGARAVGELARSGGLPSTGDAQRLFRETLRHWEQSPHVEEATAEYLDLLETLVAATSGGQLRLPGGAQPVIARMWENVVKIGASGQRLVELGRRLLDGNFYLQADVKSRVGRDVLRMDPPGYLAAQAHLAVARHSLSRQRFREARHHLEQAVAASTPKDSDAVRQAQSELDRLVQPVLRIRGSELYRPGSYHALSLDWRNVLEWSVKVRRVDPMQHLRLPRETKIQRHTLASWLAPGAGELVHTRDHQDKQEWAAVRATAGKSVVDAGEPHVQRGQQIVLDPLGPGLYVVEVTAAAAYPKAGAESSVTQRLAFLVTELGATYQATAEGRAELWLVNMEDGRPVQGAQLMVHRGKRVGKRKTEYVWETSSVATDDDGLGQAPLEVGTEQFIAVGTAAGQPVFVLGDRLAGRGHSGVGQRLQSYVLTDRPLYRPGETVHLQAFMRQVGPGFGKIAVEAGDVEVVLRDAAGEEVLKRTVTPDENGSLTLDHDLAQRPALGRYQIQLRHVKSGHWLGGGGFQVDEYRLPEFVVSAELDSQQRYVLGDTLRVQVVAEYLFGGPVSGEAEVVVTRTPTWIFWRPYHRYAWLKSDVVQPPWRGGGGEEVLRLTLPLDATGRTTVAIPTPQDQVSQQDYSYTVQARVTDSSRREESGSTTVKVTRQELYAFLSPMRPVVAPGDQAQVELRLQDAMDRGVAYEGRWTAYRHRDDVKPAPGLRPVDPWEEIAQGVVKTNDEGRATISFELEKAGHYNVAFSTRDARGAHVEASTALWCADPSTTKITHGEGALRLIVQDQSYQVGDTARVLLVSDTAGAAIYTTTVRGDGVETGVLRLSGTAHMLEIPLAEAHRPNFFVQAARARDFVLQQTTEEVLVPPIEQLLDVSIEFEAESYAPGQTATLNVGLKNGRGEPVSGPVTLAVVDEALLAILPRSEPDPARLFYGQANSRPGDLPLSAQRFGGFRYFEEKPDEASWPRDERAQLREVFEGEMPDSDQLRSLGYARGGRGGQTLGLSAKSRANAEADAMMPMAAAPQGQAPADVTVRTDFRTTALWRTAVWTDEDGTASVEVPLAESLTRWSALGLAITPKTEVGRAMTTARTRKDIMVRLNHPRVFREKDRFVLAATVHNETDDNITARVSVEAEGLQVQQPQRNVTVRAHDFVDVEWEATVPANSVELDLVREEELGYVTARPSQVLVRVTAASPAGGDAFERMVKLYPYGTHLRVVGSAEATPGRTDLEVELPKERRGELDLAVLRFSPTVLSACVDALPYLAGYPYGCTEQTLSRFVPAVAVRHVLQTYGVDVAGIDPELDAKVADGLRRVADLQRGDGGWGWWKEGPSDAYMTAYACVALSRALMAEAAVDRGSLERGRSALRGLLPRKDRWHGWRHDQAYLLYALALTDTALGRGAQEDEAMARIAGDLFEGRDDLTDYSRALLAVYMGRVGRTDLGQLLLEHLDNTAQRDPAYDTVHWGRVAGYWWRAQGAVETTACAVEAFGVLDPQHVDRNRAVRWLMANRDGDRWQSTRATAHTVFALVDFARDRGELDARYTLVARLRGRDVARLEITPENVLQGGGTFVIDADLLNAGPNKVQLRLDGKGTCYATLSVDSYTTQEDPPPVENFLAVRREVLRLRPLRTLGGKILQMEEALKEGDTVASGDRLRVRLSFTAHNDLEYIAVEDPRPAGCEPTEQLSGWFQGGNVSGRREVRDELTAFFLGRFTQGEHVLTYELRAESPGTYRVAPTRAFAMYVPDVFTSSREGGLEIVASQHPEIAGPTTP